MGQRRGHRRLRRRGRVRPAPARRFASTTEGATSCGRWGPKGSTRSPTTSTGPRTRSRTSRRPSVRPTTSTRTPRVRRYSQDGLLTQRILPHDDADDLQDGGGDCADSAAGIEAQGPDRVDLDGDGDCEARQRWQQRFTHAPGGEILAISAVGLFESPSDVPENQSRYGRNAAGWVTTFETIQQPGGTDAQRDDELFYDYDRQGNQTRWCSNTGGSSSGLCSNGNGEEKQSTREVRRSFYPSGKLMQRCAVRKDESGDVTESRTYRHGYDERGDMVRMQDLNPPGSSDEGERCQTLTPGEPAGDDESTQPRTTVIEHDLAGRETDVDERWSSGRDTRYRYTDHLRSDRFTDGDIESGGDYVDGKHASFEYDELDRNTQVDVRPTGEAGDPSRRTQLSYWPSGERRTTTKPKGNTETRYYDDKAQLTKRSRSGNGDAKTYDYDLDGNRTKDEKGTHRYNARDQLVKWVRSGDASPGKPNVTTEYVPLGGGTQRLAKTQQTSVSQQGDLTVTSETSTTSLSDAPAERVERDPDRRRGDRLRAGGAVDDAADRSVDDLRV